MPTLAATQVPPPSHWQDFEHLCCDLYRRLWGDPGTQRNGRTGQAQHGVDVFGRPGGGGSFAGVQCKLKNELVAGTLTAETLEEEAGKAKEKFRPRLASFLVATTGPRDAAAQEAARLLTAADPAFPVAVVSWEEIVDGLVEHPEVLAKHYPALAPAELREIETARKLYLGALYSRLSPLHLTGVVERHQRIPLAAVYTALDGTETVGVGEPRRAGLEDAPALGRGIVDEPYREILRQRLAAEAEAAKKQSAPTPPGEEQGYRRPLSALEAAAGRGRLVLRGPAGSGKSTFARYLALNLAGEALGRQEANLRHLNAGDPEGVPATAPPWPHGPLLPIFVELRQLVGSEAFRGAGARQGQAEELLAFIAAEARNSVSSGFRRLLETALLEAAPGALIVLDGLDETPGDDRTRKRLRDVVASFAERYPTARILLTCRPYAYRADSPWRLDDAGFGEIGLAPFDEAKIQAFVAGWYRQLAELGQLPAEAVERRSDRLWRQISSTAYLEPLAERPLLLTMMSDLHARGGGRLPGGRAALYERSVELLLDRWNEVREVLGGETVAEHLGMTAAEIRLALEELAYQVHRQRGRGGGGAADISRRELWQALDRRRRPPAECRVDEGRVMEYLHQRSGILVGESPELYRFPHRSYQEYLAACHLARTSFPTLLLDEVKADPGLWREVLLLAVARVAEMPFMAWTVLEGLVGEAPRPEVSAQDPLFERALLAGLAVRENDLGRNVQEQDHRKLEWIRQWLECTVELGALGTLDRVEAGRVLSLLGDRRRGVGVGEDGVPEIDWVEVPAGRSVLGVEGGGPNAWGGLEREEVDLPAFRIARFAVTKAQYRAFVADGGYTESWRSCWTEEGWQWKGETEGPGEYREELRFDNHPQVGVSWYEAFAFCRWLTRKLGFEVRLPSEREWEKAARGTDARAYPWGDEYEASRCNGLESEIGSTSAVGAFPTGASPYGVLDMSGNVWEWCADEIELPWAEDELGLVLRGGGWGYPAEYLRAAYRNRRHAANRWTGVGFRVSAAPASLGS